MMATSSSQVRTVGSRHWDHVTDTSASATYPSADHGSRRQGNGCGLARAIIGMPIARAASVSTIITAPAPYMPRRLYRAVCAKPATKTRMT